MKWLSIIAVCIAACSLPARAQSDRLLADAARQELEDRIRRQQAEIEDLKALVNSLSQSITTLNQQVVDQNKAMQKFNDAFRSSALDFVKKEDLGTITRSLKEVEDNREADKRLFLKKFDELREFIKSNPTKVIQVNSGGAAPARRDEGKVAEHRIAAGETVSAILDAYNAELTRKGFRKVTPDLLKQANPGLDLDRIYVGQILLIPAIK